MISKVDWKESVVSSKLLLLPHVCNESWSFSVPIQIFLQSLNVKGNLSQCYSVWSWMSFGEPKRPHCCQHGSLNFAQLNIQEFSGLLPSDYHFLCRPRSICLTSFCFDKMWVDNFLRNNDPSLKRLSLERTKSLKPMQNENVRFTWLQNAHTKHHLQNEMKFQCNQRLNFARHIWVICFLCGAKLLKCVQWVSLKLHVSRRVVALNHPWGCGGRWGCSKVPIREVFHLCEHVKVCLEQRWCMFTRVYFCKPELCPFRKCQWEYYVVWRSVPPSFCKPNPQTYEIWNLMYQLFYLCCSTSLAAQVNQALLLYFPQATFEPVVRVVLQQREAQVQTFRKRQGRQVAVQTEVRMWVRTVLSIFNQSSVLKHLCLSSLLFSTSCLESVFGLRVSCPPHAIK